MIKGMVLICISILASMQNTTAQSVQKPVQIEFAQADSFGGFDIAYDHKREILHFVYRDVRKMYYISSRNKGKSWSEPLKIAENCLTPFLKLDSEGVLHMVFTKYNGEGDDSDGILYTFLKNGKWASVDTLFDRKGFVETEPRMVIDKSNTIHLIAWSYDWPFVEEKECQLYFTKKSKDKRFSAPEFWCNESKEAKERTCHGAITLDKRGNIHIVTGYNAPDKEGKLPPWKLMYRVIGADGQRENPRVFSQMSENEYTPGDYCFDIAVNEKEVVYISSFSAWGHWDTGLHGLTLWSLHPGEDSLRKELFVKEYWEPGTRLLLLPNNDILLASGNWGWANRYTNEQYKAGFFHYSSKHDNWSNRFRVSENDAAINVDTRIDMVPKWLVMGKNYYIVYAEKLPGEKKFKFYMKGIAEND